MEDSTLEERRRKNIERNQQFLLQLFASQRDNGPSFESPSRATTNSEGRNLSSSKKRIRNGDDDDDFMYRRELDRALKREKQSLRIEQQVASLYPERSSQIKQLSEYLTLSELVSLLLFTAQRA